MDKSRPVDYNGGQGCPQALSKGDFSRINAWNKEQIWRYGSLYTPEEVLEALKTNEKTEKGEYCVVLDLHGVILPQKETYTSEWPVEAKLIDEMKKGKTLREAQDILTGQ